MSSSSNDNQRYKLYRVYAACTQRVECESFSLSSFASFILIDSSAKIVSIWAGANCGRVDHCIAENLGTEITRTEYKKSTANHIVVMKETQLPPLEFLSILHIAPERYQDFKKDGSTLNDELVLYSLLADDGAAFHTNELEKQLPTSKGFVQKLQFIDFEADHMYIVTCGKYETYIWLGNRVKRDRCKDAKQFANELSHRRSGHGTNREWDAEIVLQAMEPILFKEKFSHVQQAFNKTPSVKVETLKLEAIKKLPSIVNEAKRMTDEMFGALKMIAQQLGDLSRPGLQMDLVLDPCGELLAWKVSGPTRRLVAVAPVMMPYVFVDSAHLFVYKCKNGSKNIVYLWIGKNCADDVQAALALQCREVVGALSGASDQIHVPQGRESPLMLFLFHHKCGGVPFTILDDKLCSPIKTNTSLGTIICSRIVLEVSLLSVNLPHPSPIAIQIDPSVRCMPTEDKGGGWWSSNVLSSRTTSSDELSSSVDFDMSPYRHRIAFVTDLVSCEIMVNVFAGACSPEVVSQTCEHLSRSRVGYDIALIESEKLRCMAAHETSTLKEGGSSSGGGLVEFSEEFISAMMSRTHVSPMVILCALNYKC